MQNRRPSFDLPVASGIGQRCCALKKGDAPAFCREVLTFVGALDTKAFCLRRLDLYVGEGCRRADHEAGRHPHRLLIDRKGRAVVHAARAIR